ncbi:MAG: CHAT domain-containing protein [Saprospiraceae bacterium]|nr:CHAT domain-containing protein [Saprospiraceae bacterium]
MIANHPDIAASLHNLGVSYVKIETFEKALGMLKMAVEITINAGGNYHPDLIYMYNGIGVAYSGQKDYYNARIWYSKAQQVAENVQEMKRSPSFSYSNLAGDYSRQEKYDTAITLYKKAIEVRKSFFMDDKNPNIALVLNRLAETYFFKKEYELAETYYVEAFASLNYTNGESLHLVNSIPVVIETLGSAGRFYMKWYLESREVKYLLKSFKLFNELESSVEFQRNRKGIKSFEANFSNSLCDATITNLLLLTLTDSIHYLHESFDFAERSKAMLLYEAMQETNALAVSGIPDSLLQQEYDLRIDIAYYDKKRQEKLAAGLSDTDSTVLEIGSKLFDLNRQYEAIKSSFETDYPQYYKAKYDLSTVSLQAVQDELLQPNQSLLEYLVGDSSIFAFLVRKDTFIVKEIKHDFPLEQWVRDMTKDGIYGYYSDPTKNKGRNGECTANYTRAASQLYDKLVAPVAGHLTEQVIVMPDGALGYVPFEALLTKKPAREGAFSSYPFMLKERQISYCYSATLLREMRQKQHRQAPTGEVLAMAPFFHGNVQELVSRIDTMDLLALRDTLGPLQASGEETTIVAKLLRGEAMYGGQASLQQFRDAAGSHRIIHLSTHGKADDRAGDYAYLAFGVPGDSTAYDKLYARDLYNYSLNADMVVLSACETGIGKLRKGEGIVSLSRAFAYAGAKSIFPTLWQVSDAKTAELMRYFYKNLRKGMAKDAALRKAKLDYLNGNKGEAAHPFYWAGMIGIGDMAPISR